MSWQFLHDGDRANLAGALAELDDVLQGQIGRRVLLNQAGLGFLLPSLTALADNAARTFTGELIGVLEDGETLPDRPGYQLLGALLVYVLNRGDTPAATRQACATAIFRYRLIEDDDLLVRLAAEYRQTGEVRPWRTIRRRVAGRPRPEPDFTPDPPPAPGDPIPAPGPLPPGARVSLPPNPLFTGREDDLRALATMLQVTSDERRVTSDARSELNTRHSSLVIISTGIGGVGKTQLAAEFAHRYGRCFHGVHWVSMADPGAVPGEIAACGQMMGLHPAFSELPLPDRVALTQRAWAAPEPRLVVFDNCEDPELLRRWRPLGGGARLLVTSRVGQWPVEFGAATQPVAPLPRDESVDLLRAYLDPAGRAETDADLRRVAGAVGDLPLALALAGHFLARYRATSVDDYLAELAAAPELVPVGRDAVSATAHDLSVWRTFRVSFDRLRDDDPIDQLAKALLARAACFAPGEPLPEALLRAAAVDADGEPLARGRDLTDALAALVSVGLLERPEAGLVRLHRLLARFAATVAGEEITAARAAVEKAVIRLAYEQLTAGDPRALRAWETHLRHVVDSAAGREDETAATLGNNLGYYLQMSGDLAGARPYYERALAIWEASLGAEHPNAASAANNLSSLLQAQGDLAGARPYLERVLAIFETSLGAEHLQATLAANNLGMLLQAQGDLAGARPYVERALAIWEASLGAEHPNAASAANNLGSLLQAQGDLAGARPYYERALAIFEAKLGPDHPHTKIVRDNLGRL
jgi:tetratricopeptide (TPR) repeat protein